MPPPFGRHDNAFRAVLVALLVGGVFWFGAAVRTAARGQSVAEPVAIRVCARSAPALGGLHVSRITRNLAEVELPAAPTDGDCREYRSEGWFSAAKVSWSGSDDALSSLKVTVGGREWVYGGRPSADAVAVSADGKTTVVTVAAQDIRAGISGLPGFGEIMNWPGDARVIFRGLAGAWPVLLTSFLAALALIFGFLRLRKSRPDRDDADAGAVATERSRNLTRVLLATALSLISFALFIWRGATAFDWPAMDMGPFLARHFDPAFAPNDFFTDSSSLPNPRWIFGYFIIGLTRLFATDWYTVCYFLKVFLVMAAPAAAFLALAALSDKKLKEPTRAATAVFVLWLFSVAALFPAVSDAFTIALWPPVKLTPDVDAFSTLLGFLAIALSVAGEHRKKVAWAAAGTWFLAVLFHPAKGLCLFAFYLLADADWNIWRSHLRTAVVGVLFPLFILRVAFPVKAPLSTAAFVYHYIKENHVFHYFPSSFSTATSIPWPVVFCGIIFLTAMAAVFGLLKRQRGLALTSVLLLAGYAGSVLLEWVFVELYPVKIFAVLGPVRYTAMGFWTVALAISWAVAAAAADRALLPTLDIGRRLDARQSVVVTVVLLSAVFVAGAALSKDDPFAKTRSADSAFTVWIGGATSPGDVFVTHLPWLSKNLPLVYGRATFTNNGFPFREDDFVEFDRRKDQIFGGYADWEKLPTVSRGVYWTWTVDHYRNLTPADFRRIASRDRADYVVIEKGFDGAFVGQAAVFENDQFLVYKISDLK